MNVFTKKFVSLISAFAIMFSSSTIAFAAGEEKFPQLENVELDKNTGEITWDSPTINGEEATDYEVEYDIFLNGNKISSGGTVSRHIITTETLETGQVKYELVVKKDGWLNSDKMTLDWEYTKPSASLEKATNLKWSSTETGVAQWDAVDGAWTYQVLVHSSDGKIVGGNRPSAGQTSVDLSMYTNKIGSYTFEVIALSENLNEKSNSTSDKSDTYTIDSLNTQTPEINYNATSETEATITLTLPDGLSTGKEEFAINRPDAPPSVCEYSWGVSFSDSEKVYSVNSMYFKGFKSENKATINDIQTDLWEFKPGGNFNVINADDGHTITATLGEVTNSSITWNIKMPESENFNLKSINKLGWQVIFEGETKAVKSYSLTQADADFIANKPLDKLIFDADGNKDDDNNKDNTSQTKKSYKYASSPTENNANSSKTTSSLELTAKAIKNNSELPKEIIKTNIVNKDGLQKEVNVIPVSLYSGNAALSVSTMNIVGQIQNNIGLQTNIDNGNAIVTITGGFGKVTEPGRLYYPMNYLPKAPDSEYMLKSVKGENAKSDTFKLGGTYVLPKEASITVKTNVPNGENVNIYIFDFELMESTFVGTSTVLNGKINFASKAMGQFLVTTGNI